ncbi:MAG: hypothetical protein LBT12_08455 [Oscillospiraceae bacterium]|jgi:hypothetical protein|nr:hypothetical protein [Oscillospiraceae bacterium]
MDLKNNKITVGELLQNAGARGLLTREFPQLVSPAALLMARGMTLEQVLALAAGSVPPEQIARVLRDLERL